MGKEKKGPKSLVPIEAGKSPKSEYREDWREMRPAWRVGLLEMVEPFGWHKATAIEATQVRERLAGFESMTWKEILYQAGHRNHLIYRRDLSDEAQQRLEVIGQDDIDAVMSLGVTRMGRVFGILEHHILKLLWWDPEHLVCPAERRNA